MNGNLIHRAVILLWMVELTLFPLWAVADLGYSMGFRSNYVLRYSYLALLGLAALYHVVARRKPFMPLLSLVFIVVLVVGSIKGLMEGNFNSAFLSHVYYASMPVAMVSYGCYFYQDLSRSPDLRKLLRLTMIVSLIVGAIALALFIYGYQTGHAAYNAIGLWNAFFAGPFLLNLPFGALSLTVSVVVIVLAAKRGVLLGFAVYWIVALFIKNRRLLWLSMLPLVAILLNLATVQHYLGSVQYYLGSVLDYLGSVLQSGSDAGFSRGPTDPADGTPERVMVPERLSGTIRSIMAGDVDAASSGRLSEVRAALAYLMQRLDHILLGAGFGAHFVPWVATPDYVSHYSHFSPISFMWFGGILLPIAVYGSVLGMGLILAWKARQSKLDVSNFYVIYWLFGIAGLSMLGAVLMNNSWLWMIIGWAYGLLDSRSVLFRNLMPHWLLPGRPTSVLER